MSTGSRSWIVMLYFYLISAICVITLIFTGIQGLLGLYKIIDPETNLNEYEWRAYSDLDHYKLTEGHGAKSVTRPVTAPGEEAAESPQMSDEEWQKSWEKYRQILITGKAREGRQSLVLLLITAVVCVPIFLLHWRFARRYANEPSKDNSVDKAAGFR